MARQFLNGIDLVNQLATAIGARVSATDRILGRSSAGAGGIEEITCTAAGRALIDDADASAQRTTLELKTGATTNITTSTSDPTGGADGDVWIKYTA